MEKETIVLTVNIPEKNIKDDIEVPISISANDLVVALNTAYSLNMDINDVRKCFLKAENPISLLKGNRTLDAFGLHDGTAINIDGVTK